MSTDERIILKGHAAIGLWKQGKDVWNQWVEEHPEADINFKEVDFGTYRNAPDCHIPFYKWPFAEFRFPKGAVSFDKAQFGKENVSLSEYQSKRGF